VYFYIKYKFPLIIIIFEKMPPKKRTILKQLKSSQKTAKKPDNVSQSPKRNLRSRKNLCDQVQQGFKSFTENIEDHLVNIIFYYSNYV
jgi:hypothetical protein